MPELHAPSKQSVEYMLSARIPTSKIVGLLDVFLPNDWLSVKSLRRHYFMTLLYDGRYQS